MPAQARQVEGPSWAAFAAQCSQRPTNAAVRIVVWVSASSDHHPHPPAGTSPASGRRKVPGQRDPGHSACQRRHEMIRINLTWDASPAGGRSCRQADEGGPAKSDASTLDARPPLSVPLQSEVDANSSAGTRCRVPRASVIEGLPRRTRAPAHVSSGLLGCLLCLLLLVQPVQRDQGLVDPGDVADLLKVRRGEAIAGEPGRL